MTFNHREYNREHMRRVRALNVDAVHEKRMVAKGKCPVCEMLLKSKYHEGCPWLPQIS